MLKVALSHDIDRISKTYQYFTHFTRSLIKSQFKDSFYQIKSLFLKNTYWNFDEIIKIENAYNVKSTFFFLNESLKFNVLDVNNWALSLGRYNIYDKKIIEIIKWLDQNGWEIGVHGSYNSFKDYDLLKNEKRILENIVGHEIIGIRQHFLNLYEKTWDIQKRLGFKYDSSFGYTEDIGFKEGKIVPFSPFEDEFTVYPQIIMDTPFMENNNRWHILDEIIATSIENKSLLVINWHNDKFNENEFPGFKKAYLNIIEKCISNNAIFYKLGDYFENGNK